MTGEQIDAEIDRLSDGNKSVLVVLDEPNENVQIASANLPNVQVVNCNLLNTYEIVSKDKLLITKKAIKSIEEAYK